MRYEVHTTGEKEWDGTTVLLGYPVDERVIAAWKQAGKYLTLPGGEPVKPS